MKVENVYLVYPDSKTKGDFLIEFLKFHDINFEVRNLKESEGDSDITEKERNERKPFVKPIDRMFEACARYVVSTQSGSTSMLQRNFNLGYNRAGRIMDQLEAAGIVGCQIGSKPREVIVRSNEVLNSILSTFNA